MARNDILTYGGGDQHPWYYRYEMDALMDPQAAEAKHFPEPRPNAVSHMREVFSKYAAMTEDQKQEARDALMRKIDGVLQSSQGGIGL